MKSIKNSFLALSVLSLTACMSTQPPVITQESNEVYQFDDNASFALNVAQMTRKTAGLSDAELPEDAQFKANRGLVGAEYAMSFLTGGLVDLAGSMGAQSQADRAFTKTRHFFRIHFEQHNQVSYLLSRLAETSRLTIFGIINPSLPDDFRWRGANL